MARTEGYDEAEYTTDKADTLWIISIKTNFVDDAESDTVLQVVNTGTTIREKARKDIKSSGVWIESQNPKGWFMGIKYTDKEIDKYLAAKAERDAAMATAATGAASEPDTEQPIVFKDLDTNIQEQFKETVDITYDISDNDFIDIKNVAGVFGLPYQFLPTADPRIVPVNDEGKSVKINHGIGYEYSNKIIERIPLLFIAPGRPAFLKKYSKKQSSTLIEALISEGVLGGFNKDDERLQSLLEKGGRYYTFNYSTNEYYEYVNAMCRAMAVYLEIQDIKIPGSGSTTLNKLNWEQYTSGGISSIASFGNWKSIPFYVDTDTSISESWSNSTAQSQLASTISQASDMAKEINFLLGMGSTAMKIDSMVDADMMSNRENIDSLINKLTGSGAEGFLANLGNHLSTIASGGKLHFPEIWGDSTFTRTYSCHFKFISPDPSNLSVYLNVLVPLIHLMCLVAPQTIDGNVNSYSSPFLVRAIYKGMFNVDTGMITSMSVTKGGDCQWTKNGIPTSIEVDIEIKDLYNVMAITPTKGGFDFGFSYDTLNNTALMDYIANLCGINIFKPEIRRSIEMWYTLNLQNKLSDFIQNNIWGNIQDKVQNLIMNIYR